MSSLVAVLVVALLAGGISPWVGTTDGARAQSGTPTAFVPGPQPVLLFGGAGMNRELVQEFAAEGAMPQFAAVLERGAHPDAGLLGPLPATTGAGLWTILTGTWPAEHGIVGDRFYRTGSPDFADFAEWTDPGLVQADTLPQAAERAGKSVVAVGWDGIAALDPPLAGPVVGAPVAYSRAGIVTNVDLPGQPANSQRHGIDYERIELSAAEGWAELPSSFSPALETSFTIDSLDPSGPNPDRAYTIYVYDSTDDATANYDRLVVAASKEDQPVADISLGAWQAVPVELSGERAGEAAGFWVKALELTPEADRFRLYFTPVSRIEASWEACGDRGVCAGSGGFAEALNRAIGVPVREDAAALAAGVIDEATFVDQGTTGAWQTVDALRFVIDNLDVAPDLLLLGTSFPASVAGQVPLTAESETDPDATGLSFLRESYRMADQLLAAGQEALGPKATTIVASPSGLVVSDSGVDAGRVLVEAGLVESGQPANCVPGPVAAVSGTPNSEAPPVGPGVKACWSGGTAAVYINLEGREAAGTVPEDDYNVTQDAIVAAFEQLVDPANTAATVVADIRRKEELRDLAGADALHPSRAGDVVVTLSPPYRFVDSQDGQAVAATRPEAVGGFLGMDTAGPDAAGPGMLLVAGPGTASGTVGAARAIDVAPTAAFLLGVPGPFNASGSILLDVLSGADLSVLTLLDISDFHGQLTPLLAPADDIDAEGAVNDSFAVGGVAFLAPWFDRFRAEAAGPTLLFTAGDAVGASPPISSYFGDLPTIEAMNALDLTADGLGNHNFDVGAEYMLGTLAPAASFPYLSANLVPARADATPEPTSGHFQPSLLRDEGDIRVGIIGFSNPDIPLLTRPGALDPYRVVNPTAAINEEAVRLRADGAEVVIAIGHMGATGGTITEPTGPVVEVADQLQGVDVVVADHTDFQVSAMRPNGMLIVENRSKGITFTRVQIVVDDNSGEILYRTADHHRPWNAGVAPDADLKAALDMLQAELAPLLGEVIGSATAPIPRADACGMETGRTCESLIGNVITDAMRTTYDTDFAITNSGGIRAPLTCPEEGADFCPTDAGANAITRGQVLTVLPFGNVAVTVDISGAELKAILEAAVGRMPEASGAFPQVSGLCFSYDLDAAPESRVTSAVRQAADGTCTGPPLDLSAAASYSLATNDFSAAGGDGYPVLLSRASTRDILADVVAEAIAGNSALTLPGEALDPGIEGRIVCVGEGCPVPAAS